jgi:5'-nucleotidase
MENDDADLETDQYAIKNNYVSITPVHFDLTDYDTYDGMKSWNFDELKVIKEAKEI